MNTILDKKAGIFILLLLIIAINFLASLYPLRIDLTKEKRYTISKSTINQLRSLDDDIEIDVFLKGDFPAGFQKLAKSTEEFLRVFKDQNNARISYRFLAPEEMMEEAPVKYGDTLVAMGVNPINLTVQIKGGQTQKYVFPVALIRYKNRQTLVNLYSGGKRVITPSEMNSAEALMEYQFAKALDDLTRSNPPLIAYSVGNGEPMDARTFDMRQILQKDFQLFTINIQNQPFIADTFKVLLIVKPSIGFTEDEKLKIDQYLMRGGTLLMFIDALFAEQDSLRYKTETIAYDRNLKLDDLLFRYGVRINPDLVMDLQSDFMPFAVGGTNENPQFEFLHWNYYPLFESQNNHVINRNLGLVSGRFVNSLDTLNTAGIKKTVLLASSPNARTLSTPARISLNENRNTPEDAAFKQSNIPVAVLLEGRFSSLYRNRISKDRMDSLRMMNIPFRETTEGGKIIIASDGDMMLNDVSTQDGPLQMGLNLFTAETQYQYAFANREFLSNCIGYLTDKPGLISIRNKNVILRLLDPGKLSEQKTMWQAINILVPVLLIFLFAILYYYRRKRKYAGRLEE